MTLGRTQYEALMEARIFDPQSLVNALVSRRRRTIAGSDGRLVIVAADHTARGKISLGSDPLAMADRYTLLDRLVQDYAGQFVLAKVDADENMRIAGRHQAKGFPTVIAYSYGQVIDRFHGMQTEGFLRRFLSHMIDRHASHKGPSKVLPGSLLMN
jgi:hypothetical protein